MVALAKRQVDSPELAVLRPTLPQVECKSGVRPVERPVHAQPFHPAQIFKRPSTERRADERVAAAVPQGRMHVTGSNGHGAFAASTGWLDVLDPAALPHIIRQAHRVHLPSPNNDLTDYFGIVSWPTHFATKIVFVLGL
jgi:hypothetical protein